MKIIISILLTVSTMDAFAIIPDGYYANADGKKYTELKEALYSVISSHTVLGYSGLWTYYPTTYYHVEDKDQVMDMYSDTKRYYNGTTKSVLGLNKEHTVPASWFGGSTSAPAGNDLFNVLPSDEEANSKKSNLCMGEVSSQTWTNGISTIGTGCVNGYEGTFFEPADKYKGDFARIYFYMATCYPDLSWNENNSVALTDTSALTLKYWIIPMLIEWSTEDPVDSAEIQRNEDIYVTQNNRNPFIDYPELVNYIWGDKSSEYFYLADHKANTGTPREYRTFAPIFSLEGGTKDTPKKCIKGQSVTISGSTSSSNIFVRLDDGEWIESEYSTDKSGFSAPEYTVTLENDSSHIEAFCTSDGHENSDTLSYYYNLENYSANYLLYDNFEGLSGNNTVTSGQTEQWYGDGNFPNLATDDKVFQAGDAIRLGTKSLSGTITSRILDFKGGDVSVELGVKGWTTIEGQLNVSVSGSKTQTVTYTSTISDPFETASLSFTGVTANPTITVSTTAKRCFVDRIYVKDASQTSIRTVTASSSPNRVVVKTLRDGHIIIDKNGKKYNLEGQIIF